MDVINNIFDDAIDMLGSLKVDYKEFITKKDSPRKKKIFTKYAIISLYTIWETTIKDLIMIAFNKYGFLIVDEEFWHKFIENILSNSFSRKNLEIRETDQFGIFNMHLSKKILSNSNNVKFNVAKELFDNINFKDLDTYMDYFYNKNIGNIKQILEKLSEIFSTEYRQQNKIFTYIDEVVERRNKYSHMYQVEEVISEEQFELLIEFYELIYTYLKTYVISKVFSKVLIKNKEMFSNKIIVEDILYENKITDRTTLSTSMLVNSEIEANSDLNNLYICQTNLALKLFWPIKNISIENMKEEKVSSITKGKQYFTIETYCIVKKENEYKIISYNKDVEKNNKEIFVKITS